MRRLDLTDEQKKARTQAQTRARVAKHRALRDAPDSVTDSVTSAGIALHSVTPASLHARDDVRSTALVTTTTSPSPPSPPARANKSGELIDLLRAAGVAHDLTPKDHAALKRSGLSAAQVAEVYVAIARHEFGDAWLCRRLSVSKAIETWPGYANEQARGPHAGGRESTGTKILRMYGYAGD